MQKKTVSLRTKQHIYESYITIHYQIILFFIKNINDYLNDGWLMKDVKRSANTMKTMKDGENRCASFHHSSFRGTNRKFDWSFYQLCYRSSSYQFQYPLPTPQVWTFYCDYHNILILYLHSCVILLEAYVSTESQKRLFVNQDFGLGKNGDTRVKFR